MRSVRLALVVVLAALGIVLGASTAFAEARAHHRHLQLSRPIHRPAGRCGQLLVPDLL
jgi:hypothetical protein